MLERRDGRRFGQPDIVDPCRARRRWPAPLPSAAARSRADCARRSRSRHLERRPASACTRTGSDSSDRAVCSLTTMKSFTSCGRRSCRSMIVPARAACDLPARSERMVNWLPCSALSRAASEREIRADARREHRLGRQDRSAPTPVPWPDPARARTACSSVPSAATWTTPINRGATAAEARISFQLRLAFRRGERFRAQPMRCLGEVMIRSALPACNATRSV